VDGNLIDPQHTATVTSEDEYKKRAAAEEALAKRIVEAVRYFTPFRYPPPLLSPRLSLLLLHFTLQHSTNEIGWCQAI
jgi:hypothetical protein